MTAELETLIVAAYVFAASLAIPRRPAGLITDQDLIALAVAQAVTGLSSDRQFLGWSGVSCRAGSHTCPSTSLAIADIGRSVAP